MEGLWLKSKTIQAVFPTSPPPPVEDTTGAQAPRWEVGWGDGRAGHSSRSNFSVQADAEIGRIHSPPGGDDELTRGSRM